jgi:hypothetical protein
MTSPYIANETFIEIYRNFNVSNQIDKVKTLTRKQQYILLNLCIEKHNEDDLQVIENLSSFVEEVKSLQHLFKNYGEPEDPFLNELSMKYGKYLNISIEDIHGNELPEPYSREEVRELKLNNIFDK